MSLYAIADLHLPLGIDKPMDIFGKNWENYVNRLEENWKKTVSYEDTVVLAGDFSWATYLEESKKDFEFLSRLPGKKIMLKGNHDYWWSTVNKMQIFLRENGFLNIDFLQNNSFEYKDMSICGSRGWTIPQLKSGEEDKKIFSIELIRMELSLKSALHPEKILAFTHFPTVMRDFKENEMTKLLSKYNVKQSVFGHIHLSGVKNTFEGEENGIEYTLVSADYREFMPVKIAD
ncbi:MAG: metallophosphoesterase [Clostridia bacterium]|nr:metallophosphoesterase [Clostridia bacterium]